MTALGLVSGWFVGYVISVLADFLPRYSSTETQYRSTALRCSMPAIIQFAQAIAARESLSNVIKLNLAVEVITSILFAAVWAQSSLLSLAMSSLLCAFLILVAVIDLRYRLVLNILIFPAMALTLIVRAIMPGASLLAVLLGGAFGLAIFALVALLRPGQLGGGDVKLATLIGLIFAFPNALWALLIGVLAGGVASVWLLTNRRGNAQTQIAYAPFLVFGALVALLYNPVPSLMYRLIGF